jgi:hypothetical protein
MSSKLTKKKIDLLIEQVLMEKDLPINVKDYSKDDYLKDIFTSSGRKQTGVKNLNINQYKNLSNADRVPNNLTAADYEKAGIEDPVVKQVLKHGYSAHKKAAIDPIKDPTEIGDIKDIEMGKQVYEPESIAFGQMANIGMQSSNPTNAAPLGKMAEGLAASISTFFDGTATFEDRVQKISKFSETVFKKEKIDNPKVTEVLAASLFLDYLTTVVREIDAGAGAYQFEALLAAMAGGAVTGKDEGAAGTGQMGAVDFIMNDGSFGSSKYYSKAGSGDISQAYTGFSNKVGKTTLYIIAHKKGTDNTQVSSGEADPTKIIQLNIYLVSVMPLIPNPTKPKHFKVWVNGGSAKTGTDTSGKLNISPSLKTATPIVIKVAGGGGDTLRASLKASTQESDQKIKDAYSHFQEVFKEMYNANQKAQRYASTGDTAVGNAALTSLSTADDKFIDLAATLSGKEKADIETSRTITENKTKSLKDLDKLIEHVILNKINK